MKTFQRKHWIDILRGLMILAIVMGHIFSSGEVRYWLFSFHVPVFFFLTGYNFHAETFGIYLNKKIRTIVVPYLCFSLLSIMVFAMAQLIMPSLRNILECSFVKNVGIMLYGNSKPDVMKYNQPLWFLTCFFSASMLFYLVEILRRKCGNSVRYVALCLGIVSSCFFSANESIALPWHLETAFSMIVWVILGSIVKEINVEKRIKELSRTVVFVGAALLILMGNYIAHLNVRIVGVRNEHYGIVPIYLVAAAIGITGFIFLSMGIKKCSWLEIIGKKSLSILVLHKFPILFFQELFPPTARLLTEPDSVVGMLVGILVMMVTSVLCLMGEWVIAHVMPWTLGYSKGEIK